MDERLDYQDDSLLRIFISFYVQNKKTHRLEFIWGNHLNKNDIKMTHDFHHIVLRGPNDKKNFWYKEDVDLRKIYNRFWNYKK